MRSACVLPVWLLLIAPFRAMAQDIPPYVPANPVLESRSALYAQPFISPHAGWRIQFVSDYYNAVEVSHTSGGLLRQSLFDAEVLQADLWATRDVSRHVFVFANVPLRGGYDGFLDGFLIWYHHLTGLEVPARDQEARNAFTWNVVLPDTEVTRSKAGTFLGDVRAGGGVRFGHTELIASVTLPTATIGSDGWSRHVVGTSLALSQELIRSSRVVLDAGASAGFTPAYGALGKYQRSVFVSGVVSTRWRFAGHQAVFASVWAQTPNWRNTDLPALDNAEFATDFGFLLQLKSHWPELQLGMTQDLWPRGPAMDVGFSVGLRW